MKKRFYILVFLMFCLSITSNSQSNIIEGKVYAFKEYPLNKVEIVSSKSKKTVYSDSLGNFQIEVKKKDLLKFNANGFFSEKVKTNGNSNDLKIKLLYYAEDNNAYKSVLKSEHLTKEALDYCIDNFMETNNNYDQMSSIYQIIQTVYMGASIEEIDWINRVVIGTRGPNSFYAANHALLVVDGIVVEDISNIHPLEVRTVKVLVGTQAGHWGVRGGNGVVEIKLKDGSE
jgi:hypothetical protein